MNNARHNKLCEWFGHRDVSTGNDKALDCSNEELVCSRCGDTHNQNAWGGPRPPAKIRKVAPYLLLIVFAAYFLSTIS